MKYARAYIALTCAVVAGLLSGAAGQAALQQTIADDIHASAVGFRADTGRPKIRTGFLLQATDCTGNLRMLHLLHRRTVRESIQLNVIWFVGAANDSTVIRGLLPTWAQQVPLRLASPSLLRNLRQLGHTSTPALVVLDQEGRVRLATQSPRSSREVAGLRRIIEGLTWIEEL
jgi:hypothetical protein